MLYIVKSIVTMQVIASVKQSKKKKNKEIGFIVIHVGDGIIFNVNK